MTHDPLCPVIPADENFSDWGCQCFLIAKVRADERADALQDAWTEVASSALSHILVEGTHPDDCSGCGAVKRAILALNRLRGEP